MFIALASTKILFINAVAYALWLLCTLVACTLVAMHFGCYGNLKSFHRLIMLFELATPGLKSDYEI